MIKSSYGESLPLGLHREPFEGVDVCLERQQHSSPRSPDTLVVADVPSGTDG